MIYMRMIKEAIQKPEVNFWVGIIIPLIGIAVAWGIQTARVAALEARFEYFGGRFLERCELVDARLEKRDEILLDIQVKLAEIQTDLTYIKKSLE